MPLSGLAQHYFVGVYEKVEKDVGFWCRNKTVVFEPVVNYSHYLALRQEHWQKFKDVNGKFTKFLTTDQCAVVYEYKIHNTAFECKPNTEIGVMYGSSIAEIKKKMGEQKFFVKLHEPPKSIFDWDPATNKTTASPGLVNVDYKDFQVRYAIIKKGDKKFFTFVSAKSLRSDSTTVLTFTKIKSASEPVVPDGGTEVATVAIDPKGQVNTTIPFSNFTVEVHYDSPKKAKKPEGYIDKVKKKVRDQVTTENKGEVIYIRSTGSIRG